MTPHPLRAALLLAVLLPACVAAPLASGPLPLTELARSAYGSSEAPGREVVRDAATWTQRWRTLQPNGAAAPPVDFEGQMVLIATLGARRTGGYAIEIVSATLEDDALVVRVRETGPAPGAMLPQVLTAPYHAVRVARTEQPLRWLTIP